MKLFSNHCVHNVSLVHPFSEVATLTTVVSKAECIWSFSKTYQISSSTSIFLTAIDLPLKTKPGLKAVPSAQQLSITVTSSRLALQMM